jgi:hypothetical protein
MPVILARTTRTSSRDRWKHETVAVGPLIQPVVPEMFQYLAFSMHAHQRARIRRGFLYFLKSHRQARMALARSSWLPYR